jgi:Cohesin domain/Putative Ig domain/Dockerin type I domain
MKRLKYILLIYGIILMTGQAFAAEVTVNPSTRIVAQMETFDVNLTINPGGTQIAGAQLNLEFNPSLFRVNSITEGNLFSQKGANTFFNSGTIDNSTGTVINVFNAIIGNSNVSTQGTFIIINATAIGITGTSGINLSNVKISDPNGLPVMPYPANGTLLINDPPVLSAIGNKMVYKGKTLTFSISATDPNGNPLKYYASNLPQGATFDNATATFQWNPAQSGISQNIHFEVSDGFTTDFENIMITVNNPVEIIVLPPGKNVTYGKDFLLNVSIDTRGTAIAGAQLNLAFNKSILKINNILEGNLFKQGGASTMFNSGIIDNTNGTVTNIYGTILGSSNITTQGTFIMINATAIGASGTSGIDLSNIMVSDPSGAAVSFNATGATININTPPAMGSIGNRTVDEGQLLSFKLNATDSNGDSLSYSASNLPTGAIFNTATRSFMWTPTFVQSGTYPNVRFEVSDGVLVSFENITITVNNVNRPPTFTAMPANGSVFNETEIIYIKATASDLDNDSLGYIMEIDGKQVSTSPGYNWTTNYSSSGNHVINISVSDGLIMVSKTISVYVNNVYPRYDVNENGVVDIGDLTLIAHHFNEMVSAPYPRYDVNMDGFVNIVDIVIAAQHFGEMT